jgi:nucleoside 2-deoxyribosyltransferase
MVKKIYICTPLSSGKFDLNWITKVILEEKVFAFIPPEGQLQNKEDGAQLDKLMIDQCDELWAFGSVGRDCAWEMGYAKGLGKEVRLYFNPTTWELLKDDWMLFIDTKLYGKYQDDK